MAFSICFVSTTYNELVPNSNKFSLEKSLKNKYAAFLYMKKKWGKQKQSYQVKDTSDLIIFLLEIPSLDSY